MNNNNNDDQLTRGLFTEEEGKNDVPRSKFTNKEFRQSTIEMKQFSQAEEEESPYINLDRVPYKENYAPLREEENPKKLNNNFQNQQMNYTNPMERLKDFPKTQNINNQMNVSSMNNSSSSNIMASAFQPNNLVQQNNINQNNKIIVRCNYCAGYVSVPVTTPNFACCFCNRITALTLRKFICGSCQREITYQAVSDYAKCPCGVINYMPNSTPPNNVMQVNPPPVKDKYTDTYVYPPVNNVSNVPSPNVQNYNNPIGNNNNIRSNAYPQLNPPLCSQFNYTSNYPNLYNPYNGSPNPNQQQ